jgi:hypothetical protein
MAPLTGEDFHNPKLTGPRASKHIPGGGVFSAYGSVKINAPPQVVYDVLLNVGEYKDWNTFVYDVHITKTNDPHHTTGTRLTGGTCMIFYRKITDNPLKKAEVRHVVTLVEKLKLSKEGHNSPCVTRIRWQLDNAAITTPGFLMKSEQINEIEEADDGTTTYRTWTVFGGPIAKFLRKNLEEPWRDRTQDWCRDLKERSEMKAKESETGVESGQKSA